MAYLNYTTFDNESGLSLSLINQRRSGGVEGVNVNFIVNYLTTEGASGSIPGTANSNQDGVALFTLTPSQTSGISSIEGISVSVDNPSISTQSLTISDPEDLPAIEVAVVGVNDIVTIISSFVQEFWQILLIIFISIIVMLAISTRALKMRASKRRAAYVELENAQEEIEGLLSIQAIILKNSETGIPFYYQTFDEEDDSIDLSLIASLTTAISTFLSELQEGAMGFETMERQGISLTSHRLEFSDMIVISKDTPPLMIFDQMTGSHRVIEEKFRDDISNPLMIQEIDEKSIENILASNGFKIGLKGYNKINKGKNNRLKNRNSVSRTIRSNLSLLDEFADITDEAMVPITLQSLMDYLETEGLNKEIASRLILVAYQYEVIENAD